MKKQCALFVALFLAFGNPLWSGSESMGFSAVAQTGKVSGVVKDTNGEPLIGASVLVKVHPMVYQPISTVSLLLTVLLTLLL